MDFIRPAYFNGADIPDSIRKKIPWVAEAHEQGLVGPGPKPTSRDDGVYCVYCALWDIDTESRQYKPKPRTPKLYPRDGLEFRYDPSLTNLSRMVSRVAVADNMEELAQTTKTSLNTNQSSNVGSTIPEMANKNEGSYQSERHRQTRRFTGTRAGEKSHSTPVHPKLELIEPALSHDSNPVGRNPVYVNSLVMLKIHQHFCRLCHLLLNTLIGCPELENSPWGDDTAVYVDRFEFAALFDEDKIKEDAESRPKPGWPGFDASVMGMLHRHQRMREAKEEAVPERLSYRFCVRLDDMNNPSIKTDRRFCMQRSREPSNHKPSRHFSGLQGRAVGTGEERMQRWLMWSKLCLENHRQTCFPDFIREDYPTLRLVDVRRRCIVDQLESRTYTALSYVWGAKQNLVLTKANYAELHTPGALADSCDFISKTVRDVLNLCQHVSNHLRGGPLLSDWETLSLVGWEYIWIDALCIVQDDPTDKQHHINRMDKVYAGAWQTIVAASKEGAESGLSGVGKEIPSVEQHVDYIDGIPFMSTKHSYLTALTESQWETRGWTFQEKHLSKRLLVFTDEQCFWHCSCATWYEDTELEFPNASFPNLKTEIRHPDDPTRDPRKHLKWDPQQSDIERYRMLADSYVRRKLKYDSDGLDSIKAVFTGLIDKDIRSKDDDRKRDWMRDVLWSPSKRKYFWALPEIYLPAFLLTKWTTEDPWSSRRDHFPSWSWLSRSLIDTGDEVLGCHISEAEVTPRVPFYRFDDQGKPVMLECVQVYKSGISPSEDEFDSADDKRANIPSIVLVDGPDTAESLNKEHEAQGKNVLALNKQRTPCISRLLAFRELTCKLWVDTEPIQVEAEELCDDAPDSVAFHVRFKEGGPTIGLMHLHKLWRRRRSQWLDFVVVNETADFISTPCLNLLCVEWDGPIATRVQALIAVKINEASAAHPVERKLILLA